MSHGGGAAAAAPDRTGRSQPPWPARPRLVLDTRRTQFVGGHAERRGRAIDLEVLALEQLLGDEEGARISTRVGGAERTGEQAPGDVGRVRAHRHDEDELPGSPGAR
jgi:hypothetical protein